MTMACIPIIFGIFQCIYIKFHGRDQLPNVETPKGDQDDTGENTHEDDTPAPPPPPPPTDHSESVIEDIVNGGDAVRKMVILRLRQIVMIGLSFTTR